MEIFSKTPVAARKGIIKKYYQATLDRDQLAERYNQLDIKDFDWKNSNQNAEVGTMHVRQLSEYIFKNAFNTEPNPEYGNIILQPREVPWLR
jgi:hypothetical protein